MIPTVFGLSAFWAPMSRGAKKQKQIRLFGFGPCDKAKAKKPNSAFWLIGGVPIGSKIGFGGVQKQNSQKASVPKSKLFGFSARAKSQLALVNIPKVRIC